MPIAEAHVRTERASRYLVQLCRHAGQMSRHPFPRPHTSGLDTHAPPAVRHVEWDDTRGMVTLNQGRWTLDATPDTLTLRAEAETEEDLQRIQDLLAARLEKIGRRDHLTVVWQRLDTPDQRSEEDDLALEKPVHAKNNARRWSLARRWAFAGIVAVLIAVHLGLGGAALAVSRWTDWTVIGLVVLLLAKVVGLRALAARRGKAPHASGNATEPRNHMRDRGY